MKNLLNNPDAAVDEALEGFLGTHSRLVRRIDTARVVVRATTAKGKVGVVTGGGSGHKPAFIGYVGQGLLDAVAVGDIFTSPSSAAALEAIRAADTGAGVLFVLGNYAGDVLNFRMAAETARREGHAVELAIITDDIAAGRHAVPSERRGVAGSILVWKAAGAAAEAGSRLDEVRRIAEKVIARLRTTGVASGTCAVPGSGHNTFTLADDELEIGVGLHGDRGVETIKLPEADDVVDLMLDDLLPSLPFKAGAEVVTLINGSGGTPLLELYVAQRRLRQRLDGARIGVHRSYVGEYITALDTAGYSITLLEVDEELRRLLDAPARAPHFVEF